MFKQSTWWVAEKKRNVEEQNVEFLASYECAVRFAYSASVVNMKTLMYSSTVGFINV